MTAPYARYVSGDVQTLTYKNPAVAAATAGDCTKVANLLLIAHANVAIGDVDERAYNGGLYDVTKEAATTFTDGQTVYVDTSTGYAVTTPNANTIAFGPANGAPAASATSVRAAHVAGVGQMARIPTQTVAAAGTTAANAAALIEGFNLVTGPDDTKGVVLPSAVAGMQVIIKVGDGADLKVWPATGDAINGLSVDAAMTVVDDVCFTLTALNGTTWYTSPLLPS